MSAQPRLAIPPLPPSPTIHLSLSALPLARRSLTVADFRHRLRQAMLAQPSLTLAKVASSLGVTRQRVALMVGRLDRPNCATPNRPAPKRDAAARGFVQLVEKVRAGESAEAAAADLGISLGMAMRLGFRAKKFHPPHGTRERAAGGGSGSSPRPPCRCWRCRRAVGIALPRGRRADEVVRARVLDWLAYNDPDTGEGLRQIEIGKLAGVGQAVVSRIARAAGGPA